MLNYGHELGYEFTFGEAFRSDEQAEINSLGVEGRERLASVIDYEFPELAKRIRNNGKNNGIRLSIHQDRLAMDINVFKDGVYLSNTSDLEILGSYWESLDVECRWGGRFRDGNHFSLEHNGRM
jgi:hypothetical protein